MYIYVSRDKPPRILLVKDRSETHCEVLESLGIKDFDRYFISDIDIGALKRNKMVIIEVSAL